MEQTECPPVTVEGDWSPAQTKTVKNKLQLYFQSKKKSSGGDCRVEAEDGAPRAAVYFRSEEVRERVLARQNHEIILENQTVKLRLISASSPANSDDVSDSSTDSKTPKSEAEPGDGASADNKEESESVQSLAVVLDNVVDSMTRDLLSMLVENISGLDESGYSLEIIWETNRAVITFTSPADVEKFLAVSQSSQKLQKHQLTARPLEAANSVRVESLPPTVVKDMLELYFEKNWALPDNIVMIPTEQAAIVTFSDPKVVESICTKQDYVMRSIPVKVYPYYESLGTALYGKDRPTWKMPEPFVERVHHAVWKFLLMKKLLKSINNQMRPYFCSVDLDNPEVKLSPLPSFLRRKGLTAKQVDMWMSTAQEAFRQQMSQYTAFECTANAPAWKAAEKEVRSVVREDAVLVLDASRGILTVAGQADNIKQIRAPVENIVLKAMSQIKRQTDGVSEGMIMSPAMFYILKQEGLQKAALDISPDMNVSYDEGTQKLSITGLPAEVYQTKSWILERNVGMSKKQLNIPPHLLDFLKSVDPMDMSQDLFTSQGISAMYSIESKGVFLLGSSDSVLADAESKMKTVLSLQSLDVEDQEVLKLHNWVGLNQELLDTYNSLKKKTVAIQIHPERGDKITVAGFQNPVKEVSRSLKEFIVNYSRAQETIRVKSCAVVQFIDKKKSQDWSRIAKTNNVTVHFDAERPKIIIAGARLHVQKAKSCFQELTSALSTDNLIVDKPGAKKYFLSQGSLFLSTIMTEFSCVVVLRPENQDKEEAASGVLARPEGHGGPGRMEQTTAEGLKIFPFKGNIQDQNRFTRKFKHKTGQRNFQSVGQSLSQSQQSSASFSQVSSPSLGVYQMQMGQLTLEVSSGDITREASDVIINSSNQDFTLKSGVSKAILDSAGLTVQLECSQIVNSPGYQPRQFILTSAGRLPSRNIIHIVGQIDPVKIKDMVYSVLKFCEENKFSSVSFPALGTGQGGANPSAVADAMVEAVVEFVRKTHPRFVHSVKILIFQTVMVTEFHRSMKRREGEEVEEKSIFTRIKDSVNPFYMRSVEEQPRTEEFEPAVFQLCADNDKAVSQAKKRIKDLIVAEQAERTITDQYIGQLSQDDMDQLTALQRKLTVSIRLDRGLEDQEPKIHLEGLIRDVFTAESAVRDIIRRVERTENSKRKALLLEETLETKQIVTARAAVKLRKAVLVNGRREVALLRKDMKDDSALPAHWDDMRGDLLKRFPLAAGSREYNEVEKELQKTGLPANIISIERVQNPTLWQNYQLMKKQLEIKNKHTNNERLLFHGTGADSIDLINKRGFNRSYAGTHGAMYGNGTYFAVNPAYSARGYAKPDASGHKRMYLARVLVGDFTQGRRGMITPPSKGSAADLYDSVADTNANPTMFVVFNDIQAYPEYLITFI